MNTDPTGVVQCNYSLWFGWRYSTDTQKKRMTRLGDRFTWAGKSYNVLVSDMDRIFDANQAMSTHPDRDGKLRAVRAQDDPAAAVGWAGGGTSVTNANWSTNLGSDRSPVDLNFAFDDASVLRYDSVLYENDPRMDRIPDLTNSNDTPDPDRPPMWGRHVPSGR